MFEPKPLILGIFLSSVLALPAPADGLELPSGVTFGMSFSDLQTTAEEQDWDLRQTTFNTNAWSSDAEDLTFYFCNQVLSSIDQYLNGGLRGFVETVWQLELKYGKASTETFVIAPRSDFETHGVQSVFELSQGTRISVLIQTRNDEVVVWSRKSNGEVCEE